MLCPYSFRLSWQLEARIWARSYHLLTRLQCLSLGGQTLLKCSLAMQDTPFVSFPTSTQGVGGSNPFSKPNRLRRAQPQKQFCCTTWTARRGGEVFKPSPASSATTARFYPIGLDGGAYLRHHDRLPKISPSCDTEAPGGWANEIHAQRHGSSFYWHWEGVQAAWK